MKHFFSKFSRRTWIIIGVIVDILLVTTFLFTRSGNKTQTFVYSVQCGQAMGSVRVPADSNKNIQILCVSTNQIAELDKLVKAKTGNTNEVLGAVTLEPSPISFNTDVTVTIPLLSQRQDLAGQYHDLYVYAPNVNGGLLPVNQALIANDGWSGTTNVDHFSTFILVGPSVPIAKLGDMVEIPAGKFQMGNEDSWSDEQPVHTVFLDTFYIDTYEVTNGQYEQCVKNGVVCALPSDNSSATRSGYYGNPDFADYPVIDVDWYQASVYCSWAGKRLPTEAEWEKAARGTDGRVYPWGNEDPNSDLLNYNSNVGDTTAVGSYPKGASPYGVYDMAGNVWEWVNDWYSETYYKNSPLSNPFGTDFGQLRVLRGGSWGSNYSNVRSASRNLFDPSDIYANLGFRCAISSPEPTKTLKPELGEIILEERFADNSNNWYVGTDTDTEATIEGGKYKVRVLSLDNYFWFTPPVFISNVDVTADAEFAEGAPENAFYGFLCNFQDADNFYRFRISPDGTYSIDKRVNGGDVVSIVDWAPSSVMKKGIGATNSIRAICNESHLTLYINGTLAADVKDTSLTGGSFQLMAGGYKNSKSETKPVGINFSNLTIRKSLALTDAFDDNKNGWGVFKDNKASAQIENGQMVMKVIEPESFYLISSSLSLANVDMAFDATIKEGSPANSAYGAACRRTNSDNRYFFGISGDGRYTLNKRAQGKLEIITDWSTSSAIKTGDGETNRVRIICSGNNLELYVNDQLLISAQDISLNDGTFTLQTGRFKVDDLPVTVAFDNLEVKHPGK